jgi:hypothetical protein
MPVSTYKDIVRGYPVDLLLYANNYTVMEEGGKAISYFSTPEEAVKVFRSGARMAKGTTSESGLVESYFANPFGPAQKIEETDVLLKRYFDEFFASGVKVGEINTQLGVKGMEKSGPRSAAIELFNIISSL